ncbi:nucleoside hydrolase [Photobacterium kasasachensis]|uniref:nucleoside hydrolase n=1 Tax=Photobacterium kasasachensis TaxID=2910240 RepID=UPI003D0EA166
MRKKIILDTDPGIDDAMAILFALAHPDIDLVGITTVYGNATIENGTRNALYLKEKFNFSCDIAKGTDKPIQRPPVGATVVVHGETGFGDLHSSEPEHACADPRPAYQYIIDTVKANPGEITLVTVGPLTNIALALDAAPEITSLVKEVVVMGGAFGMNGHRGNVTPYAEANIHDDPHAADKVFTADWPVVIVGLDVTEESFFSADYIDDLKAEGGKVGEFIWDVSRYYLRFYANKLGLEGCHVHDPSAIAYVIKPELFTLREGPIRVVTDGPAEGLTLQKFDGRRHQTDDWAEMPEQKVGIAVNDKELLALYRDSIINYSKQFG